MAAFSAVWGYAAFRHQSLALSLTCAAIGGALLALVLLQQRTVPKSVDPPESNRKRKRDFWIVLVLEFVLIQVVVNVLINTGHATLLLPGIGLVVGLHFFPLASIFNAPAHYLTGALITIWSLAMFPLGLHADVDLPTGIGVAAILFSAALRVLFDARRRLAL